MPWSRNAYGGLAAALLVATFGLAFLDLNVVSAGISSVSYDYPDNVTAERVVSIRAVEAGAGDVLRVEPVLHLPAEFTGFDFYVVEGGEGAAFRSDARPEHVYAQRTGLTSEDGSDPVFVRRPAAPDGSSAPDRLDMVWVVRFAPGVVPPEGSEGRPHFDRWLRFSGLAATPTVTDADAASFARASTPVLYVLTAASVATLAAWIAMPRRKAEETAHGGGGGEAGLALVEAGGSYLRTLRNLLLGVAPVLAYAAWASLFIFWNETAWLPGTGASWPTALRLAVGVTLAGTMVAWAVLTWRVHGALRRWREWQAQSPVAP